jgi:hypothetical protein
LSSTSSTLAGTFTMPTNIQAAYLDVYAQSQSSDEFWYTCVPTDVATELQSCSNTGFRETEISIDGQPAGVAPVFPWIFTGGIDPYLWFPIPGVQTLNFVPYRVNLTPFAGVLSNGQPHTVSLSVYNANNYFSATASLLFYLDASTTQVTGGVTTNTLAAPNPVVTEKLNVQPTSTTGTVGISSNRSFEISGFINTASGPVTTRVRQSVNFSNNQYFNITGSAYVQSISQVSQVTSEVKTSGGGSPTKFRNQIFNFPLKLDISLAYLSNGNINQTTTANQLYKATDGTVQRGKIVYASAVSNSAQHTDTLEFDSSFNLLGNTGQTGAQQFYSVDSTGKAYACSLSAAANVLTAFTPGCAQ